MYIMYMYSMPSLVSFGMPISCKVFLIMIHKLGNTSVCGCYWAYKGERREKGEGLWNVYVHKILKLSLYEVQQPFVNGCTRVHAVFH